MRYHRRVMNTAIFNIEVGLVGSIFSELFLCYAHTGSLNGSSRLAEREPLFHSIALQRYLLLCSQVQIL